MSHLNSDNSKKFNKADIVYTPIEIAKEIVDRYQPIGRVLDPCCGDGAFYNLIPNCFWCEITRGRNFFDWNEPVEWIISNPPYSILNAWLEHSFDLADNVVYLVPIAKIFGSLKRLKIIKNFGGIKEIYVPWSGRQIGFEFGWPIGAVHFQKDWKKQTSIVI